MARRQIEDDAVDAFMSFYHRAQFAYESQHARIVWQHVSPDLGSAPGVGVSQDIGKESAPDAVLIQEER